MQSDYYTFLVVDRYVHVSSRRVGDVFEGGASGGEKSCALRKELGDLERVEKSLDELIHSSTAQLKQLTEHEDNQRYPLHADACVSTTHRSLVVFWVWLHVQISTYYVPLFWPLTPHCTLGYVTYQDIRSIGSLKDQTVIAVKAPADTKLEVPDTAGVREHVCLNLSVSRMTMQIYMCRYCWQMNVLRQISLARIASNPVCSSNFWSQLYRQNRPV